MVHATDHSQTTSTPRLHLRPISPSLDAPDVLRIRSNPAVTTYLHSPNAPTPTLSSVETRLTYTAATNTLLLALTLRPTPSFPPFTPFPTYTHPTPWAAHPPPTSTSPSDPNSPTPAPDLDRSTQRVIGTVGISAAHELGFVVDEPWWGMGLATEAVRAAVARWKEGVPRAEWRLLCAVARAENGACLRVLEKSGFERSGRRQGTGWEGERVELVEWRLRAGGKGWGEGLVGLNCVG